MHSTITAIAFLAFLVQKAYGQSWGVSTFPQKSRQTMARSFAAGHDPKMANMPLARSPPSFISLRRQGRTKSTQVRAAPPQEPETQEAQATSSRRAIATLIATSFVAPAVVQAGGPTIPPRDPNQYQPTRPLRSSDPVSYAQLEKERKARDEERVARGKEKREAERADAPARREAEAAARKAAEEAKQEEAKQKRAAAQAAKAEKEKAAEEERAAKRAQEEEERAAKEAERAAARAKAEEEKAAARAAAEEEKARKAAERAARGESDEGGFSLPKIEFGLPNPFGGQLFTQTSSNATTTVAVVLIGLFMGSGVSWVLFRFRRIALVAVQEPLLPS
jgi:primosomal protein N'